MEKLQENLPAIPIRPGRIWMAHAASRRMARVASGLLASIASQSETIFHRNGVRVTAAYLRGDEGRWMPWADIARVPGLACSCMERFRKRPEIADGFDVLPAVPVE